MTNRKKLWISLSTAVALLVGTVAVFGEAPETIINDVLKIGRSASTNDKIIEFETGDSPNNVELKVDDTNLDGFFSVDVFSLGDGAGDQALLFNEGSALANQPRIKWDDTSGKLQFSNDGTVFKSIGSGAGGGGGINMLVDNNFDFEGGTTDWTNSGSGTFSVTTTAGEVAFDTRSGKWDAAAASDTLSSASKAISDYYGLRGNNCEVNMWYKGGDDNITLQAYDGSNTLCEVELVAQADYFRQSRCTFPCPATGNIQGRLIASADAAIIYTDNWHLGENVTTEVSQAEMIAQIEYQGTSGCQPGLSGSSYATFPADSDCVAPTATYQAISVDLTDRNLLSLKFTGSLPPGVYEVEASVPFNTSVVNAQSGYRITDGTNNGPGHGHSMSSASDVPRASVKGVFTYTTAQSAPEFSLQGKIDTGSVYILGDGSDRGNVVWTIKRFPLQSQTAVSPDTVGWYVDVNIGGDNPNLGVSDVTAYTPVFNNGLDMVINSGSASAEIPCASGTASSGLTCSGVNEHVGAVFDIPRAGTYEACVSFTHNVKVEDTTGASCETIFQIVETSNTSTTIISESNSRVQSGGNQIEASGRFQQNYPHTLCGVFNWSSAGQKTIRLMYEQQTNNAASSLVIADRLASYGDRDSHIVVKPINQHMPAPLLVNSVVSPYAGVLKIASAYITYSGGVPSVTSETGDWIASLDDNGTGQVNINVTPNTWTTSVQCFGNSTDTGFEHVVSFISVSTTDVHYKIHDSAGTVQDINQNIFCIGH